MQAERKTLQTGEMIAQILEHGEALLRVGNTCIALEPQELEALYLFLKEHYEHD